MKNKIAKILLCLFVLPICCLSGCKSDEHVCQHVCPDCRGCMDDDCHNEACSRKCDCIIIPTHECKHVCDKCGKCLDETCTDEVCKQKCECLEENTVEMPTKPTKNGTYLFLNSDGSYGGNYDKDKYGTGAPLNGANDNEDSVYYTRHDWYNMKSSASRKIIYHFQGYQQTMENTDGIACLMMILNREGYDIEDQYSEINLVNEYERLNSTTIADKDTTPTGLGKLIKKYGFKAQYTGGSSIADYEDFCVWALDNFDNNRYMMVRYQDGMKFQWHIVIGYDDMGTPDVADDVVIFADPLDRSDHYQDGYSVYHMKRFFHWWKKGGKKDNLHELVVVTAKHKLPFEYDLENDEVKDFPEVPEHHMLLNKNGTMGGSYGDGRYSKTYPNPTPGFLPTRENLGRLDYSYYAYPDYYNMEDSDTREICTGYRAYKQTMASSCGICSTMTILNYHGQVDWSTIGNYITRKDFVGYDPDTMPKFGGVDDDDNGRKQEAIVMIYSQGDSNLANVTYTPESCKFYNYGGVGSGNLKKVSQKLGYSPITNNDKTFSTYSKFKDFALEYLKDDNPFAVSWNPTGGHWEVVIGYDTMGTSTIYDDVIVLADSSDGVDHYIDGYNTLPGHVFYGTWWNGSGSVHQQYVAFKKK